MSELFAKAMGSLLMNVDASRIPEAVFRRILQDPKGSGEALEQWMASGCVSTAVENHIIGYLRLISGGEEIVIGATNGQGTIAEAEDTFLGWIDPKFVSYGTNVDGKSTKATPVQVYEMIKDGTTAQIFGGFGENLDRLCLSQGQIIQFCRNQTKRLRFDSYTFFLLKVGEDYFVVNVYWSLSGLKVTLGRLSNDHGRRAAYRHRIVVPKL